MTVRVNREASLQQTTHKQGSKETYGAASATWKIVNPNLYEGSSSSESLGWILKQCGMETLYLYKKFVKL